MSRLGVHVEPSARGEVDVTCIGPATMASAVQLPQASRSSHDRIKRVLDIVCSVLILVLTAPIIAIAAVAIRIESPGPVFFRQERLGRGGKRFQIVKLRGMYVDAKVRFPNLYDYSYAVEPAKFFFHFDGDPRVTRVGRFLRKYSLDELPNFWNVLRGEMSIVGPRPEIPELAHLYGDDLIMLLSVLPGVTSPAKARGRDFLSFVDTLRSDLHYIENRSIGLDLAVIWRTMTVALRGTEVRS
jgi:lipopolysaccharide/colanic/teichoic acid biosynthesis glycosyltransferase